MLSLKHFSDHFLCLCYYNQFFRCNNNEIYLLLNISYVNCAFIFLYIQGRILTVAGVTAAICSAPFVGLLNLIALAVWPDWVVVAICETLRKVAFIF